VVYLAIPLLVVVIGVASCLTGSSIMIRGFRRGWTPSPVGEPLPKGEVVSSVLMLGGAAIIALGGLLLVLFLLVWSLLRVV
jgi:hypothetical protein